MSCILIIEGLEFDVNGFLKETELNPYEKHLKGDKRPFKKLNKPITYETSGCRFDLSKADFNDFKTQREDVIRFLNKNYEKLEKLNVFGLDKKESPIIGFGIKNQMADFWCQTEYLQPELLKLTGNLNIGIEMSLYHPATDENEAE
ncbi:hypothetical protein I2486_21625 [Cellulophaga sp. E16_2]|uniref:hypothetical protein n=1 Tax=unclassified Cellulophaga TaxID=2634405 RepID=UPI0013FD60D1|nr:MULTISPECIES: hypothetical protein [unclassified Cellulophaga]MBO0594009.1 hypothetical protein [Cellulophaga sp. E16_2]